MSGRCYKQRQRIRRQVFRRDGGCCWWCEKPVHMAKIPNGSRPPHDLATIDHIEVASFGGKHRSDNVVLACLACNQERGTTPAEEFLAIRRARAAGLPVREIGREG